MENVKSKAVLFCRLLLALTLCIMAWSPAASAASFDEDVKAGFDNAREGSAAAAAAAAGSVQRSLETQPLSARAALPEFSIQEAGREMKGAADVEFQLKWIRFQGNRVISSEELIWLVDEFIDQTIKVNDLQQIADAVTAYYRENGYILTRAYVPPQNIDLDDKGAGKISIVIHEGRLGRVIINGNERYSKQMIRNVMKVLSKEGVISADSIERTLLLLMDYPGLRVRATFVPSVEPGTTNVVLDVEEDRMLALGLDYNNFGSKYVARHRGGLNVSLRNLTGRGDALNFRSVFGPEPCGAGLFYNRLSYELPLGYNGTRLGLAASYVYFDMGEKELAVLDSVGRATQYNLWVSHPLIRSRNLSLWVDGGMDYKSNTNELFAQYGGGFKLYDDVLVNARIGSHLEYVDRFQGRNIVSFNLFKGLNSDIIESRLQGESQFAKAELKYARIQMLSRGFMAALTATGQITADRLPASEQIQIGGAGTVRGYGQSEYSGDSGYYGTLELRMPVWDKWGDWFNSKFQRTSVQLAAFVDFGQIWVTDAYLGEVNDAQMLGAGLGVRFAFAPYLQAKLDWARNIGGEKPLDKDDDDNGVWYFQVNVPY